MQNSFIIHTRVEILTTALLASVLLILGCERQAPSSSGGAESAEGTGADGVVPNRQSVANDQTELFTPDKVTPAVEECCTSVGKMDECWWEDAIRDGVTCKTDADCEITPKTGACIKDPSNPGDLGVCRCNIATQSHCFEPSEGRYGVCITDPRDPSDPEYTGDSRCGPSYCNGWLKCSCFGGCEWWDQTDPDNTPEQVAEEESLANGINLVCCEGNYPWGGVNEGSATRIISFYGVGSCDPGASIECVDDSECDDGSPCTVDSCNGSNICEYTDVADYTPCGSGGFDSDTLDCVGPWHCMGGICVESTYLFPDSDTCGADTDTADCIDGNFCNAGSCEPNVLPDSATCGVDADPNDCFNGHVCMAGSCDDVLHSAGTLCQGGVDTDPTNCLEQEECDAIGGCIPIYSTPGETPCEIDTNSYPPNCWAGYCGGISSYAPLLFDTDDPATGNCLQAQHTAAVNEDCSSAEPVGAFTGGTGATYTVVGSTACATDNYSSSGRDCYELDGTTTAIGAGARDVVFSFTYTPTTTQTDLYAFFVSVEGQGSFTPSVYARKGSDCATAASNDCIRHPGPVTGTDGYRWEYAANYTGENWNGASQVCDATGYEWCSRTGGWSYTASPTVYQFSNSSPEITPATVTPQAQTVIFPTNDGSTATQTFYVIVDGRSGETAGGNFTLTVEGRNWNNGQCERVFDDPRVYDATEYGTYNGSIEGYANSTHAGTDTDCGGYTCGASWGGVTAAHDTADSPSEVWPAQAFFKLQPTGEQSYCLRVVPQGTNPLADPVIELREVHTATDLCSREHETVAAESGSDGITLLAKSGSTWMVTVSEANAPVSGEACSGNCNYSLIVSDPATAAPACTGAVIGSCSQSIAVDLDIDILYNGMPGDSCVLISQIPGWWTYATNTVRFFKNVSFADPPGPEMTYNWQFVDVDTASAPNCASADSGAESFPAGQGQEEIRFPIMTEGCGVLIELTEDDTDTYTIGWGS